MFKLTEDLFTEIVTFVPSETLFGAKAVSKKWNKLLSPNRNIWKNVVKQNFPGAMPLINNHEAFVKCITQQELNYEKRYDEPQYTLDNFEFILEIYYDEDIVHTMNWKGKPPDDYVDGKPWLLKLDKFLYPGGNEVSDFGIMQAGMHSFIKVYVCFKGKYQEKYLFLESSFSDVGYEGVTFEYHQDELKILLWVETAEEDPYNISGNFSISMSLEDGENEIFSAEAEFVKRLLDLMQERIPI